MTEITALLSILILCGLLLPRLLPRDAMEPDMQDDEARWWWSIR